MGGVGTPPFAQETGAMNVEPSVAKHKTEKGIATPTPMGGGGRRGVCPRP